MPTHDQNPDGNVISLFGGPRPASTPRRAPARTALHAAPEAPSFDDPRQDLGRRTLGKGTAQLGRRGGTVMYNLTTGMAAASVDLGRLQGLLEGVIVDFEQAELAARWREDVEEALQSTILEWVQRLDAFELELHESGVRVSLQTQDDFGYYQYGLDVFPGRSAT